MTAPSTNTSNFPAEYQLEGLVCIGTGLTREQRDLLESEWILYTSRRYGDADYYYVVQQNMQEVETLMLNCKS